MSAPGSARADSSARADADTPRAAFERSDHSAVLALTDDRLALHPGDDAAHALRARSLLALGRPAEAEHHAAAAVRLDPDEADYRELLAMALSRQGAHREAAAEYARLARTDPHQVAWNVAEAVERIDASQADAGVQAARRATRLEPGNGRAQLALSRALARVGDAGGACQAAARAVELLPADPGAREALADAYWLADRGAAAFSEFRALANELEPAAAQRVTVKARSLYVQRAGWLGRAFASVAPLFEVAFRRGWVRVSR